MNNELNALAPARRVLDEAMSLAHTDDDPVTAQRHARIIRAANDRMAELGMLLTMASGERVTCHPQLASLHGALMDAIDHVTDTMATNGMTDSGLEAEDIERFCEAQEDAADALAAARTSAACVMLHMGRALESMKAAVSGVAVQSTNG